MSVTSQVGADEVFSWASPSAKQYREYKEGLGVDELIDLMLAEPRLIRRPILIFDRKVILGFKKSEYIALKNE